jgi:TetR/AcrR family transcriptional regulator, repressor for neighboring sulfatase
MTAILDAASELFAEQGPAATSIREVATRSRVNHGLVYRYFGTKEELVAAVLDHVSDQFNQAVAVSSSHTVEVAERQWRVLARAILDGYPVGQLQHHFPFVTQLVAEARGHAEDETAARLAAGHVVALELGWRLFEPFIRSAAGLEHIEEDELWRTTGELSRHVLATPVTDLSA